MTDTTGAPRRNWNLGVEPRRRSWPLSYRIGIYLLLMLGGWAAVQSVAPLKAQEPPAAAEPAAAEPQAEPAAENVSAESLGRMILDSGTMGILFYLALAVCSIVAVTVTLERAVNLRRAKIIPPDFLAQLQQLLRGGRASEAELSRLADSSKTPIAGILKAGLLRIGRPLPEVEKGMEDAASREISAIRARVRPLGVIGSVAPLVGLLGPVVGLIIACPVSSEQGLGRGELLAKGIYLALMTTAAGLTIAIPCLIFSAWFNSRAERFFRDIDEYLMESLPTFSRLEQREEPSRSMVRREPVMAQDDA